MIPADKIYFPGLNGLRAFAALIVLVSHIDQFTLLFGFKPIGFGLSEMAGHAVTLFFVLSGFLITFLLLREKELFSGIDLAKFYTRRILRILPLYYLIILLTLIAILFVPTIWYSANLPASTTLYVLMLANVAYTVGLTTVTLVPLWSVGVEEQFYALWPVLMNQARRVLPTLFGVILVYLALKLAARVSGNQLIYEFILITRIDCMALGGIGAYLVYKQSAIRRWFYNPVLQIICWLIFLFSVFVRPIHLFSILDDEFYALVFLVLVLNVSSNPRTLIHLEHRLFDSIGRISYGIYVYHMLIIYIVGYILLNHLPSGVPGYIIIYLAPIAVTLIISYLSFEFFESRFIKLKHNVSRVASQSSRYSL